MAGNMGAMVATYVGIGLVVTEWLRLVRARRLDRIAAAAAASG
jgi:uncharacterized membrane protein YcjF (UPF0283 family)